MSAGCRRSTGLTTLVVGMVRRGVWVKQDW